MKGPEEKRYRAKYFFLNAWKHSSYDAKSQLHIPIVQLHIPIVQLIPSRINIFGEPYKDSSEMLKAKAESLEEWKEKLFLLTNEFQDIAYFS